MSIWKKPFDLAALRSFGKQTLIEHLGIEFIEMGSDFLVATMPVDHRTKQPFGSIHGGASCVLAETLGSVAGFLSLDEAHYCLGLDLNINHIRPLANGRLIGSTKPIHLGRKTQVWSMELVSEENKLIAISRLTTAVLPFQTQSSG